MYEKFRTTNSHALVSSQFLAALNIVFGGDPELRRRFLTEFYQNMTVSSLSTEYAFTFDAFTDLTTSINLSLRRQRNENTNRIKLKDDNTDLKLKTKYEFDDNNPPPPYPFDTIGGNLSTEPEIIEEKVKQVDIVESKLETPTEIEQSDNNRKSDNDWLNKLLAGVETTKQTLQELNDQAIAAVLSDAPQIDTKIDNIFIDDNELIANDELTDENKAFIKILLDKANYKNILDDNKGDQQKLIQDDLSVPILQPQPTGDIKTEIIDNVVPPTPLFFPTENEIFEIDNIVSPTVSFVTAKTEFIPDLNPPQKTGIKSVDDKNYEDYLNILDIYRPDLFIDEEDNYVIPTLKTEIIEIDDVVPPVESPPTVKPIPVIPQEIVKLPKPIPKTDLPENIDIISAISDINKITRPNQFDNVDGDIDFNIVEQTPDDDDDVTYVRYIPPPPEVPVPPPIHPRERLKQKIKRIRMRKERYRKNAKKKAIKFLN